MARTQLSSRISDLQIEWATQHSDQSVRHFLMQTKGFTERQYRHLLARSPVIEWNTKKTEILNELDHRKTQNFIESAIRTNEAFISSANLATARVIDRLVNEGDAIQSRDLLNLMSTVCNAQDVFLKAVGSPHKSTKNTAKRSDATDANMQFRPDESESSTCDLTSEEILLLIEATRMARTKANERNRE